MKRLLLVQIILTISVTVLAQSRWERRENRVSDLYFKDKAITSQEWYERGLKEAGSLGVERKAWYESGGIINENSIEYQALQVKTGLVVHIPADWEVIMPNGNKYTKVYIFNLTDSVYSIPRVDATVAGFKDYLKIKGKWVELQTDRFSVIECGNSLYNSSLDKNSFYLLQPDSPNQPSGTKEAQYKVSFTLNGQVIESNEITVKLHKNQVKRLRQERKK